MLFFLRSDFFKLLYKRMISHVLRSLFLISTCAIYFGNGPLGGISHELSVLNAEPHYTGLEQKPKRARVQVSSDFSQKCFTSLPKLLSLYCNFNSSCVG